MAKAGHQARRRGALSAASDRAQALRKISRSGLIEPLRETPISAMRAGPLWQHGVAMSDRTGRDRRWPRGAACRNSVCPLFGHVIMSLASLRAYAGTSLPHIYPAGSPGEGGGS